MCSVEFFVSYSKCCSCGEDTRSWFKQLWNFCPIVSPKMAAINWNSKNFVWCLKKNKLIDTHWYWTLSCHHAMAQELSFISFPQVLALGHSGWTLWLGSHHGWDYLFFSFFRGFGIPQWLGLFLFFLFLRVLCFVNGFLTFFMGAVSQGTSKYR